MNRTKILLADGRELFYYDEESGVTHRRRDLRDLSPVETVSELRWDPLASEWIILAANRQSRTFLPPADRCPLDPSRPGHPTEIPDSSYDVAVFENRFPSLVEHPTSPDTRSGDFPIRPGLGRCEVVSFTSDHEGSFATLSPRRARLVMDVWADRTTELATIPGVEYVFVFENRGEEIGVTLHHPHGQIYSYPFVPPAMVKMLDSARVHRETIGGDLFARIIEHERKAHIRVVAANDHWVAFVPSAARWPIEVHVYPLRKVPDIPSLDPDERSAFVDLYLDLLQRLDRLFDAPLPYIAAWYQAPLHIDRDLSHLHLRVSSIRRADDKLKYLAGSETAMGAFINDIPPEATAERIRSV
ncbi:MAG: galactose-1-phosphate uridylyltransferase [Actinobacteria bacterium]|nr:galactose-1-phosphate uridylyltransferase [Actinomycetota bacterium]